MAYDSRFGLWAQTPQQRAFVLQQMQDVILSLKRQTSAEAQRLFNGYIAGELSWQQLRQALDQTQATR